MGMEIGIDYPDWDDDKAVDFIRKLLDDGIRHILTDDEKDFLKAWLKELTGDA